MQRYRSCKHHSTKMAKVNQYIVGGELTENCTLSQELVGRCTFGITNPNAIRGSDEEVASDKNSSAPSSKRLYWQRSLSISYPGSGASTGIILPGVVIHYELGDYFNKTSVKFGVPMYLVRLLEPRISAAGGVCEFKDKRLISDEKYWWTQCNFNDAQPDKEYIRTTDEEGDQYYASFNDFFAEFRSSVIANVTCSIKMICDTEKNGEPQKGDMWRAGLKVSMVAPFDAIDIPSPQSGNYVRSIPGKADTMKTGLKRVRAAVTE